MYNLVVLGAPGAGKGTLAKRLAESLRIPHISTGDLFRQNISQNTALGRQAESYIIQGNLVPDEVTNAMVFTRLNQADCQEGFILDGYPRSIAQAEALEAYLQEQNRPLSHVLSIEVEEAVIVQRLGNRLSCVSCGESYNRLSRPPQQEGLCDVCHSALRVRDDDQPETIHKRLETYRRITAPLVQHYRDLHLVRPIDNNRDSNWALQTALAVLL